MLMPDTAKREKSCPKRHMRKTAENMANSAAAQGRHDLPHRGASEKNAHSFEPSLVPQPSAPPSPLPTSYRSSISSRQPDPGMTCVLWVT